MNATELAKAIKETKTVEELQDFAQEHDIESDERKTVQNAYQEKKASFEAPPAQEKSKVHGQIDDQAGTIYFKKKIAPTQPEYINGKKFMVLSDTVARDQSTGKHYTIVTD